MSATRSTSLYDGGELDGWAMAGPGGFEAADGAIESRGGMGLLWYQRRTFSDFVLDLDWRVGRREDNSGVFVRFPDPGGDPWAAVHHGYEVQILDAADTAERRTGAIYTFVGPSALPTRNPGEWNHLQVRAVGPFYAVAVNGVSVTTFCGNRGVGGHIGLQNHDEASRVAFRGVRVRPLR